jgi:hypothetical protein
VTRTHPGGLLWRTRAGRPEALLAILTKSHPAKDDPHGTLTLAKAVQCPTLVIGACR